MIEDEDTLTTPPEAEKYVEMLEDIHYKIDEFIDLTLHGEIRDTVENAEGELQKEEQNYKYINTEIELERAMEEIDRAIEHIKLIYVNKLF